MKRKPASIMSIVALMIVAMTIGACQQGLLKTKKSPDSLLGTWQAVSYKYGTRKSSFTDFSPTQRRIKLITENYFTWVHFDTTNNKVYKSAGGKYTLNGTEYTEYTDFGLGMDNYLGQKHTFTIKVEGDMFFLSGSLSSGLKIEEIWQRLK